MTEIYNPEIRIMLRGRDSDGKRTDDLKDITALCGAIKLEGEIKQASRKLTFNVIRKGQDYFMRIAENINRGDCIILKNYKTNEIIFYGLIWAISENDNSPLKSVTCYDSIKFLMTSRAVTSVFTDMTAAEITRKVCKELGVTAGVMPKTDIIVNVNARDKSGYEAIMIAWTETHKQDKKIYYPRMVGFRLHVIEKGEFPEGKHRLIYYPEPQKGNLTNVQLTENSDSAVTAIFNRNEDGTATFSKSDKKLIDKLGYIVAVNDDSKQGSVEEINDGKKTVKVEAIGDWAMQTGWSVPINSNIINAPKLYIEKDTHVYENGIHTMMLELSYDNVMYEIENQEEKSEDGEVLSGDYTVQEQVWNYLRAKGFSAAATAGVMGNMERESGFNVGIVETGGTGYGLVQWTNTYENPPSSFRRTKLENWCKENGLAYNTVQGQMGFLMHEYNTYYASLIKNSTGTDYKQINDVYTATDTWLTYFEGATVRNDIVAFNVRIAAAKKYYNQWKNYKVIPKRQGLSNGKMTASQKAVVDAAYATSFGGVNLCAAWVTLVFSKVGISIGGNGNDMTRNYCHSRNLKDLRAGMIIGCESWSGGGWAGATYGHIAIYVGNNTVLSAELGHVARYTVQGFINLYSQGGSGVRWGWAANKPLY